jgi:hypothetical protein
MTSIATEIGDDLDHCRFIIDYQNTRHGRGGELILKNMRIIPRIQTNHLFLSALELVTSNQFAIPILSFSRASLHFCKSGSGRRSFLRTLRMHVEGAVPRR